MGNNINEESILITIKKLLGLGKEYTLFDPDVIVHINTVFSNLSQMGVGPEEGFVINTEDEKWSDFLGPTLHTQNIITYIYMKVKIMFDPPANSTLLQSLTKVSDELEYRLYIEKGGY